MLKGERQNTHHSKLPKLGEIGHLVGLLTIDPHRRCIVSHYPLCDNILPYSRGIHTVWVRFLDNRELRQISGIWFQTDD